MSPMQGLTGLTAGERGAFDESRESEESTATLPSADNQWVPEMLAGLADLRSTHSVPRASVDPSVMSHGVPPFASIGLGRQEVRLPQPAESGLAVGYMLAGQRAVRVVREMSVAILGDDEAPLMTYHYHWKFGVQTGLNIEHDEHSVKSYQKAQRVIDNALASVEHGMSHEFSSNQGALDGSEIRHLRLYVTEYFGDMERLGVGFVGEPPSDGVVEGGEPVFTNAHFTERENWITRLSVETEDQGLIVAWFDHPWVVVLPSMEHAPYQREQLRVSACLEAAPSDEITTGPGSIEEVLNHCAARVCVDTVDLYRRALRALGGWIYPEDPEAGIAQFLAMKEEDRKAAWERFCATAQVNATYRRAAGAALRHANVTGVPEMKRRRKRG